MSGGIVAFTPKRPGRSVEAGRSCALVESGKVAWPIYIACDAVIVAVNETLMENPGLANSHPYGACWMVVLKAANWAEARRRLTNAAGLAAAYKKQMDDDNFRGCGGDVALTINQRVANKPAYQRNLRRT